MKDRKDQDQDQIEMRIKREVRGVTNLGIEITKGQMSPTMEVPRIGRNLEIPDTEMRGEEMSQEVRDLEEMCQEVQEPEDRQVTQEIGQALPIPDQKKTQLIRAILINN